MCSPVSIIWSTTFPNGCINLLTFNYFNAAFHILTDLVLAILPIPVLVTLQLSRKRKIALAMVFGAGILTIAATIARQVYNFIALTQMDFSWNWAPAELVTNLEINMGIICASVPAMQSLFKAVLGNPTSRAYTPHRNGGISSRSASRSGTKWHKRGAHVQELSRERGNESEEGIVREDTVDVSEEVCSSEPEAGLETAKGVRMSVVDMGNNPGDGIQLKKMSSPRQNGPPNGRNYQAPPAWK